MQKYLIEIIEFFNSKGFYIDYLSEETEDNRVLINIEVSVDYQEFCEKLLDNNQAQHQAHQD